MNIKLNYFSGVCCICYLNILSDCSFIQKRVKNNPRENSIQPEPGCNKKSCRLQRFYYFLIDLGSFV